MAFNASTEWEVRTTGNDANGGGFNIAATGTDFSQQDTPQIAFTDLVIGATTTQLTSVAHPFNSTDVGNVINITSGTGFTVQRVQVVSVSGVTATCDKSCGTAASTAGVGNLGGGLATVPTAIGLAITGNKTWLKSGTYTVTATLQPLGPSAIVAYASSRGDNGRAILTTATNSTSLFATNSAYSITVANIDFSNTATTKSTCFTATFQAYGISAINCSFAGFTTAIGGASSTFVNLYRCEFKTCAQGINISNNTIFVSANACSFHNNTSDGLTIASTGSGSVSITNCIIVNNGGFGINMNLVTGQRAFIENCTIANNTSSGIELSIDWNSPASAGTTCLSLNSNVIYGNGAFGVTANALRLSQQFSSDNAVGANTSGNYNNFSSTNDKALTANPFNSSGTGDYSLNNVTGGGALCRGAGFPGTYPGGTTIGVMDIGAPQTGAGSGITVSNYGFVG